MTVIDPFANDSKYGTITNDLNSAFDTDYHLDTLDFFKLLPSEVRIVFYTIRTIHFGKFPRATKSFVRK